MGNCTILQTIESFSDSLYVVVHDNKAYIVDSYRENAPECKEQPDYAVWNSFPVEDLKRGQTHKLIIPDIYVNEFFHFLESDDFPNHYKLSDNTILDVTKEFYCDWAYKLRELGYSNVADDIQNACDALIDNSQFKPMTDEEIDKLRVPNKTVDNYIEWLDEELEHIIEEEYEQQR